MTQRKPLIFHVKRALEPLIRNQRVRSWAQARGGAARVSATSPLGGCASAGRVKRPVKTARAIPPRLLSAHTHLSCIATWRNENSDRARGLRGCGVAGLRGARAWMC